MCVYVYLISHTWNLTPTYWQLCTAAFFFHLAEFYSPSRAPDSTDVSQYVFMVCQVISRKIFKSFYCISTIIYFQFQPPQATKMP